MRRLNQFGPLNRVATCRGCGKPTHSSIDGNVGIKLCRKCYEEASMENEHSDGHHVGNPNPACPDCKAVQPKAVP